ncbi:MAG: GNAT family N-acetyltransferase [Xanthobacteraceae bacterium]
MFARTERLLLRPGWIEDAPSLFAAIADETVVRNLATAPWPYTPDHAKAFLATERRWDEPTLLVFLRTGGPPQLVGTIGLGRRRSGELELGYWIAKRHWNRGYATEAGEAVVRAARESFRVPRLAAGHFLDNPASGRVLEKLGFRPTGVVAERFSAGRGGSAPCREFTLALAGEAEPEAAMAA